MAVFPQLMRNRLNIDQFVLRYILGAGLFIRKLYC